MKRNWIVGVLMAMAFAFAFAFSFAASVEQATASTGCDCIGNWCEPDCTAKGHMENGTCVPTWVHPPKGERYLATCSICWCR